MTASPLTYSRFKAPDAANGTLDVYEAGSLQNRKTTYSNPGLSSQNTNPVQLNSLGEADIFYTGLARLVLKDESGSQIWDKDDIGVASDVSGEWINSLSATYASSTTFTLSGDQTTEYHVNRRIRLTGSTTAYGRITVTSYSAPNTTVTVVLTSGTLDATLATVATSVISGNAASGIHYSHIQGSDVASASTINLNTLIGDYCHITGTTTITAITLTKGREITVVFDGALTLTNGASLILPPGENITTVANDTAVFRGEASGVVRCVSYVRKGMTATAAELSQAHGLGLLGYITGFVPTQAADAVHDLTFSAGACRNAADTISCKPTWSTLTKQIDASFAEGTNQGGMATGSVANSTAYYYNLIRKDSDTTVFDICIDVSSSHANTPSGWTFMREIHREFTDGSAQLRAQTYLETAGGGIRSKLGTPLTAFTDTNPGTNLVTKTLAVSPGTEVMGTLTIIDATPASATYMVFSEVGSTATEPDVTNYTTYVGGVAGDIYRQCEIQRYVDSSRNIEYELSQSTADHTVTFQIFSWKNHRRT